MKTDLHPNYQASTMKCACGNNFEVGSTIKEFETDLCSACHPFYTGKQKIVDSAHRVEKFKKRSELKKESLISKKEKKARVRAKKDDRGATSEA